MNYKQPDTTFVFVDEFCKLNKNEFWTEKEVNKLVLRFEEQTGGDALRKNGRMIVSYSLLVSISDILIGEKVEKKD